MSWLIKEKRLMVCGASLLLMMILVAVLFPLMSTLNPYDMSLPQRFELPSWQEPFGRDQNGSSIFARVVYGARISLYVAFSVVFVSASIGLLLGSLAGYAGGIIDILLMRFIDMLYAFPGFLLAIALVAVMGPSVENVILAMCVTGWAGYARLVRGEFLHLKTKDYVTSAKAIGATPSRIIIHHILPNLVGPLIVQASFGMAGTILAESALSFLGLGAPVTEPTWGSMLNAGRSYLIEAPHISIFPGLAIILLVLGFNLLGDGLRDYLDPKKN